MTGGTDDAGELVARAIESVLGAVPLPGDTDAPELMATYQPWADTASPASKGKRPLQALLDEIAARVEAEPDAVAGRLPGRPPMVAYFDRFGTPGREGEGGSRSRRKRGRGREGGGAAADAVTTPVTSGSAQEPRSSRGRRRGGSRPQGQQPGGPAPTVGRAPTQPRRPPAEARPPGAETPAGGDSPARRRRRRRGRGGGGGGAGGAGGGGGGGGGAAGPGATSG